MLTVKPSRTAFVVSVEPAEMDGNRSELSSHIVIPFHSEREAEIAYNSLRVDKEPPRGGCSKTLAVKRMCTHRNHNPYEIYLFTVNDS